MDEEVGPSKMMNINRMRSHTLIRTYSWKVKGEEWASERARNTKCELWVMTFLLHNPMNSSSYVMVKSSTNARTGLWKEGPELRARLHCRSSTQLGRKATVWTFAMFQGVLMPTHVLIQWLPASNRCGVQRSHFLGNRHQWVENG